MAADTGKSSAVGCSAFLECGGLTPLSFCVSFCVSNGGCWRCGEKKRHSQSGVKPPHSKKARRAVTLLEILLVLAVLVALGAVAWPSLDRSLADQRLRHAADMVRAQWAEAHVRAVATGTQQRFRTEPGGRRYWIEPIEDEHGLTWAAPAGGVAEGPDATVLPPGHRLLPHDVAFDEITIEPFDASGTESPFDPSGGADRALLDGLLVEGTVMFYPDGTSSSARLVLRNAHDRCVAVLLQGLTAVAKVGEVFPAEETLP